MPQSSHPSIANMQEEVRTLLPRLTQGQARVIGEMVYAMLLVDGCGLTRICSYMAELSGQSMNTVRQRYREIYYEKEAKAGVKKRQQKRREVVVEEHFADLLRGVIARWRGPKILVLALDASTLTDRFDVLSISVVTRGGGIRVAWTILASKQEGEWRPHWERMLTLLRGAVPADFQVLVMADRGLYAAWLFEAIVTNRWHPFLRVKQKLTFRAEGEKEFAPIGKLVRKAGKRWKGQGEWSETGVRQKGLLLVRWEKGYDEAINVVTDLLPKQAEAAWYQMRFWIEDDYKDGKRGWFHWEHSKMTKPERASRLWLVLSLALSKAMLVGSEMEAQEQAQARRERKPRGKPSRRRGRPLLPDRRPRGREQSVLMRGVLAIRAAESGGKHILPQGHLVAQSLPPHLYPVSKTPRSYHLKKQSREEKKRYQQRQATRPKGSKRAEERAVRRLQREEQRKQREATQAAARACRQEKLAQREAKRVDAKTNRSLSGPPSLSTCSFQMDGKRPLQENLDRFQPFISSFSPDAIPLNKASDLCPEPLSVFSGDLGPLLRLSRGRLIQPPRLLGKENRLTRDHGPAQEAGP